LFYDFGSLESKIIGLQTSLKVFELLD